MRSVRYAHELLNLRDTDLRVYQLADAWNIDVDKLPHHAQPTHINDLLNYASLLLQYDDQALTPAM